MHLTRMRLGGVPPFTEPVEFAFDERVNVFVGPNASGKSTLLRGLYSRFDDHANFAMSFSPSWHSESEQISRDSSSPLKPGWDLVPWSYIASVRLSLPVSSDGIGMRELNQLSAWHTAFGQDGDQTSSGSSLLDLAKRNLYGNSLEWYYFDSSIIHVLYGALNELVRDGRADPVLLERMQEAKKISYECAQSICSDVLMPRQLPVTFIRNITSDDAQDKVSPMHHAMGVSVSDQIRDNLGTSLFVGDLSSGTQGTLTWIWYLAFSMADFWQGSKSWEKQPAILLIDEIENHLHPTWQRRVIPALLEHFPGLQIFATTHSPFVVAGLKAGQVHMLRRDADGVVTASTNEQDIIGWTTDEILRTFMGVDEPTDQLTIDRAERLRELRGKDELSEAEATEMEGLRRQVNEDFMSSSTPLEAQRERYGDMMLEFLRSRQSELSQDGN